MADLSINDYIETIFAADGDDAKLRAAIVTIDENIQVIIDLPFVTARSMGLPPRWMATKYTSSNNTTTCSIWSPDELKFHSKKYLLWVLTKLLKIKFKPTRSLDQNHLSTCRNKH